jgi:hypothetical protein
VIGWSTTGLPVVAIRQKIMTATKARHTYHTVDGVVFGSWGSGKGLPESLYLESAARYLRISTCSVVQSASSLYIWPTLRLQLHRESDVSKEVLWCTFMIMYGGGKPHSHSASPVPQQRTCKRAHPKTLSERSSSALYTLALSFTHEETKRRAKRHRG